MTLLMVCPTHGKPEGVCRTCGVVTPCPDDRRFTPEEMAEAIDRRVELAVQHERERIEQNLRAVVVHGR